MTSDWQAALYIAAALLSLILLVRPLPAGETYLSSREAHGAHVGMNLGMAAMASAWWTPEGRLATAAALLLAGVWLAVRLAARREAGTAYHLLAVAAMLYGVYLMPAGMHMAMTPGWPALLLAAFFALDAAATLVLGLASPGLLLRMEAATSGEMRTPSPRALTTVRLSALPHLVMDAGMVAMLAFP